jgi:hypothetical protein
VPRSRKTKQFCARTGGPSLRRKSASTPSVRVAHIALTAIARAGLSITCPALSVILVIGWRLIEVALGRQKEASPHAFWRRRAHAPSQIVPASNC